MRDFGGEVAKLDTKSRIKAQKLDKICQTCQFKIKLLFLKKVQLSYFTAIKKNWIEAQKLDQICETWQFTL